MRFYTNQHRHYCGIDLHTKTMYVCILDRDGQVLVHKNLPSNPEAFLEAVAPYRDDLVVAVECIFTWYWLADLCAAEGIPFVLGHALYMKAIHGGKAKNDKIDALKIAMLLRGGMLPAGLRLPGRDARHPRSAAPTPAPGPQARRAARPHPDDQPAVQPPGIRQADRLPGNREGVAEHFHDRVVRKTIAVDLDLLDRYDTLLTELESYLVRQPSSTTASLPLLRSVPGIGKVLA